MNFRILPEAEDEAISASLWYEDQRTGLGGEFIAELKLVYTSILQNPHLFPKLECCPGPHLIRRQLMNRFPYLVIFRHRAEEILVAAVSHSKRQPFYWIQRLEN